MPKSDTWPGGITVETLGGMDSAGSCDSVVSINSGFSDDSLEQLSAEERACLMFLEETIESLEADEDSGLSNDEPEPLIAPGSLAAKMADLSSSLALSNLDHNTKYPHDDHIRKINKDHKSIQGYLVPTPLVLAKNSPPKTDLPSNMSTHPVIMGSCPKQEATEMDRTERKGRQGCQRPDTASSRGPLSYEGLMELRKTAFIKKNTPSSASEIKERAKSSSSQICEGKKPTRPSDSPSQSGIRDETPKPKAIPPTVAPKPSKLPSSIALRSQKALVPNSNSTTNCLSTSPIERVVIDPLRVRREALHKLGLLQDGQSVSGPSLGLVPSSKPQQVQNPPGSSTALAPPQVAPLTISPDQSSGQQRPRSRSDLPPAPKTQFTRPAGVKSATLERSGMGLGSYSSHANPQPQPQPRPRTTSLGERKSLKDVKGNGTQPTTTAQLLSQKPPIPNGVTVAAAAWGQPGQVRQEALRKLGLLRD
ncbi:hypothetical protein JZ751_017384 [Albula glossodonta]|uniref:Specifically androgen-regulated gene protein n=1 Tax=Albula glossodonta TaxID=121402 RepID=A0A8T2PNT1_9TELE|nr:hypothetical protein JZ751_017384 [Albula glossodonta]